MLKKKKERKTKITLKFSKFCLKDVFGNHDSFAKSSTFQFSPLWSGLFFFTVTLSTVYSDSCDHLSVWLWLVLGQESIITAFTAVKVIHGHVRPSLPSTRYLFLAVRSKHLTFMIGFCWSNS